MSKRFDAHWVTQEIKAAIVICAEYLCTLLVVSFGFAWYFHWYLRQIDPFLLLAMLAIAPLFLFTYFALRLHKMSFLPRVAASLFLGVVTTVIACIVSDPMKDFIWPP